MEKDSFKLYRAFNIVLSWAVFALLALCMYLAWSGQSDPPIPDSKIVVVRDVKITVPNEIKEGQAFEYRSQGEKLIEAPADIRMQMICRVGVADNIVTVATFSSNRPVGTYDSKRVTAVSPSSKLVSSNDCHFQFVTTYTVYQKANDNTVRPIPVTKITDTNHFKFTALEAK